MAVTKKKAVGTATIDCELVVFRVGATGNETEYAVDTASKIIAEVQTETQDGVKNVKLGRLIAQKLPKKTITGHTITLTDNVFIPEIVRILQGGTITGTGESLTYEPPVSGNADEGEMFELDTYSAQYGKGGEIIDYEKLTYPNCKGTPIGISTEDGVFRISEYVINSAPPTGKAAYKMSRVKTLPDFSSVAPASMMVENNGNPVVDGNEALPQVMSTGVTKSK